MLKRRRTDVKTTSCAYWDISEVISAPLCAVRRWHRWLSIKTLNYSPCNEWIRMGIYLLVSSSRMVDLTHIRLYVLMVTSYNVTWMFLLRVVLNPTIMDGFLSDDKQSYVRHIRLAATVQFDVQYDYLIDNVCDNFFF